MEKNNCRKCTEFDKCLMAGIGVKDCKNFIPGIEIVNTYDCPINIWNKFTTIEKIRYNKLFEMLSWDMLYHVHIVSHKKKREIIGVCAHNIACELIWSEI